MKKEKGKEKVLAYVTARSPTCKMTVEEWVRWRAQEHQRMFDEARAQLEAHFELQAGDVTVH